MRNRVAPFLLALSIRILVIFACSAVTLCVVDAAQDHLLATPTSFDIAFDRLGAAIVTAIAGGFGAAAIMVRWQSQRFSFVERMVLSCIAVVFSLAGALALM